MSQAHAGRCYIVTGGSRGLGGGSPSPPASAADATATTTAVAAADATTATNAASSVPVSEAWLTRTTQLENHV